MPLRGWWIAPSHPAPRHGAGAEPRRGVEAIPAVALVVVGAIGERRAILGVTSIPGSLRLDLGPERRYLPVPPRLGIRRRDQEPQ